MSKIYNVVFEYTTKADGYAGNRFIIGYTDEADFLARNTPLDECYKIIAQGVNSNMAQDLASLSPEICILTANIQDMCNQTNGRIYKECVDSQLIEARHHIEECRAYREMHRLEPIVPFVFVDIGPEDTQKNKLYRFIKEKFYHPDGTLPDLALSFAILSLRTMNIAYDIDKLVDESYL
jgi:hypothetical protein